MGVTTYSAIRTQQVELIRALVPQSLERTRFVVSLDQDDFRSWAVANAKGCLRRYTITDLFEDELGAVAMAEEWVTKRAEILIAYPIDDRYGRGSRRALEDVIHEDQVQLAGHLFEHGHGRYTDAVVLGDPPSIEQHPQVWFSLLRHRVSFWRNPTP